LPKIERLLITVDNSLDGRLASMLGGLFAGTRQIMASVLELGAKETTTLRLTRDNSSDVVKMSMDAAAQNLRGSNGEEDLTTILPDVLTRQITDAELSEAILSATKKASRCCSSASSARWKSKTKSCHSTHLWKYLAGL
jgi:hypothetical protein